MHGRIWIDHAHHLVVQRLEGTLVAADLRRMRDLLVLRRRVPASYARLIDARGLSDDRHDYQAFAEAAIAISSSSPSDSAKRVIVADRDLIYGRCRVFQGYALRNWPQTLVVRSIETALDYLELPREYALHLGPPTAVLAPSMPRTLTRVLPPDPGKGLPWVPSM